MTCDGKTYNNNTGIPAELVDRTVRHFEYDTDMYEIFGVRIMIEVARMVCVGCQYQKRDHEGYPYCTKWHNKWLHPTRDTQTQCSTWTKIMEAKQ